jgi:serine/threonine protein kinase
MGDGAKLKSPWTIIPLKSPRIPTMDTVESLCNRLARSKLLAPDAVRTIHKRWKTEAQGAGDDLGRFSKWLVTNGFITEFQFGVLQRGFADLLFLDDYKLLERIGQGRMAGVYKAVHKLGQIVAVKVLPPSKARHPPTLARFQREARMSMRLKDVHVVRTFQVGKTKGDLHYLVMEYLDGETLEDVLQRRGKLPTAEALHVVLQALQGLTHINAEGLVHRDLKPANLMLVPQQRDTVLRSVVKILDIGLGRALFDEGAGEEFGELTNDGALLGTPNYMAPEQARSAHTADIRADIYSLGCVLYHCLTGKPPFPDTSVVRQIVRHTTEAPKPLSESLHDVPSALQQVVTILLAKDPVQRYARPEAAAKAIADLMHALATAPAPAESEAPLKSYLKWLEQAPTSEDAELVGPVAALVPVPALPVASLAPPLKSAPAKAVVPIGKPVAPPPSKVPVAEPLTAPAQPTVTDPGKLTKGDAASPGKVGKLALVEKGLAKPSKSPITLRDLIAAAIGAGAMLVVNLVLWFLFRRVL